MSRYRLFPTPAQEAVLRDHRGHARYLWNLAVEQHFHWRPGRAGGPGYLEQCRQLTQARAGHPWLAAGSQMVQRQALRDFGQAIAAENMPLRTRRVVNFPRVTARQMERWNDHGHAASCDGEPAMTTTVLRYQTKPERAEENQQLIDAVFAELDEGKLDGFTYKVFRLEDGVSFIHMWIEHDIADPDSLQVVPAFQAFMADLADRCDVPPVVTEATVVGGYR